MSYRLIVKKESSSIFISFISKRMLSIIIKEKLILFSGGRSTSPSRSSSRRASSQNARITRSNGHSKLVNNFDNIL